MKQVFLQSELLHDVEVLEFGDHSTRHDLREGCVACVSNGTVTEPLILYIEDDDDVDAIDKLETIADGLRVHLHRLKAVTVSIRYAGRVEHQTFRPNITLARLKRWATHAFGISPSDAAELMLQIAGTDKRPDPDMHLGCFVKAPHNTVCFDLVPAPRVNG